MIRQPLRRTPLAAKPTRPRKWLCSHCRTKNEPGKRKCASCAIGRSTKRTSLKARCDSLARELVMLRARGKCERCGKEGPLDWAHIHRRAKHNVRWDPANALAMCRPCHVYTGDHPVEFVTWLVGHFGQQAMERLEHRANSIWHKDYAETIATLRAQLAAAKEKT